MTDTIDQQLPAPPDVRTLGLDTSMPVPDPEPASLATVETEQATGAGASPPGSTTDVDLEQIWETRPELHTIHQFAWDRLVSPWALLVQVLSRSLCSIPYRVRYRSTFRPEGSALNLLVVVAGKSGAGKSLLDETAAAAVEFDGFTMPAIQSLSSGEGIAASLAAVGKHKDEDGSSPRTLEWFRHDHVVRLGWDEVGMLAAQAQRQGSTVLETIKTFSSGGQLGGQKAAGDGLIIPAGQYRGTVTINGQPRRVAVLVSASETAGGLVGRIIWSNMTYPLFATVPRLPDDKRPAQVRVRQDHWESHPGFIDALPEMEAAHEADRRRVHTDNRDDSDSHQTLQRVNVSAALANLAGRGQFIPEDWVLAGLVMEHSRRTLEWVLQEMATPDPVEDAEQERRDKVMIARANQCRDQGLTFGRARCRVKYGHQRNRFDQLVLDGLIEPW